MRLDHLAYRVANREQATKFLCKAFDYRIKEEFEILFDNGETAMCYALEPKYLRSCKSTLIDSRTFSEVKLNYVYHSPPEIFVSEGSPDSIVGKWVADRNGIGGLHHIALEVEDVEATMNKWRKEGLAEFTTDRPICGPDGLTQCFTTPHFLTCMVYEFINRGVGSRGFNRDSVKKLMESTV